MNRRSFLHSSLPAAVSLPGLMSGLNFQAFGAAPGGALKVLAETAEANDHVLVLIQLAGGNDGLNMVVPLDMYANYYTARTNVAIPQSKVLRLDGTDKSGLHPAMTEMQQLFNNGKLSIVQSVGYDNPNFSHFRSTDIWMTGDNTVDRHASIKTGWMGRYLENEYPGYPAAYPNHEMPDPLAIQISSMSTVTVQGSVLSMGLNITDPLKIYSFMNPFSDYALDNESANKELRYLRVISEKTRTYSEIIRSAYRRANNMAEYPDNELSKQLQIVARLIQGGLKTKVYAVSMSGFDTHKKQVNAGDTTTGVHAKLMKELSASVSAFQKDMELMGLDDRVMGMTFSEFGRRIKSNASMGTDHGTAAPLVLFGRHVKKGILGASPEIPASIETNTNLPFQYDFRSVYASVLEKWFCVQQPTLDTLLLQNYQSLPLISAVPCGGEEEIEENNMHSQGMELKMTPNPFSGSGVIRFTVEGGFTLIQLISPLGRVVKVFAQQEYAAGSHILHFSDLNLPAGIYFLRLQNGPFQKVISVMKAR